MNVVLIPYFLAANIVVNDTQPWLYGPEFTYRGVVDAISERTRHDNMKMHLEYELKCRNQNESSLICRISDVTMWSTDTSLEEDLNDIQQELSAPFLINFDENGVESVSISDERLAALMKLYQYVASLFHVGADLGKRSNPSAFHARESSVLGDCETNFNISTRSVPDTTSNEIWRKKNYSLYVIPYSDLKPGSAIEIDKVRKTRTCNAANLETNHTPLLSKTKIYIDSTGIYKSDVKDAGKIVKQKGKKTVNNMYRQHLSLELVSIERATPCFVPILFAKTAGLEIDDYDSDFESDSDSSSDSDSDSESEETFLI